MADTSIDQEIFKTIRLTHLVSLGVAATALIVLFAPFQVDFKEALKEAALLKSLNLTEYEMYVRRMVGTPDVLPKSGVETGKGAAGHIILFIQGKNVCCIAEISSPDWSVTPALQYGPPPVNGSLEEWSKWMNSTTPAKFLTPDWFNASVSLDTRRHERPDYQAKRILQFFAVKPASVSVFSVRPEDSVSVSGSEYRFFAFLEDGMISSRTSEIWWPQVIAMEESQRWDSAWMQTLDKAGRSVVEGFVKGSTSTPVNTGSIGAGSVNLWLRTHPLLKNLFDTGLQPEPLPRLHEHWSVLGDKSLSEAIGYMEQQQRAFKDVAILGITVPGQLCVVALPLAFIASFGYLYLHLRMAVVTSPGVAASFPWIGIYDDWLAAIVTSLSLTWVPFLLMVGIVLRYWSRLGTLSVISSVILDIFAILIGILADRKTRELRSVTREGK